MYVFGCDNCLTVVVLRGDYKEADRLIMVHPHWRGGWPCVTDGCTAKMDFIVEKELQRQLAVSKDVVNHYELTPEEFFRALCGMGLPDELGCGPEVVEALLLSSKVTGLRLRKSPTDRTLLDAIELANGTVIHLTANPHGAVVYKITRKKHEQADHDLRALQQDPQGDGVQREDRCGRGGDDDGEPGDGRGHSAGSEQHDDGRTDRGAAQVAEESPERQGDDDPQNTEEADGGKQGVGGEGVGAGPDVGGHDQNGPAGGAEAVRAD